jgi:hypothetical protein
MMTKAKQCAWIKVEGKQQAYVKELDSIRVDISFVVELFHLHQLPSLGAKRFRLDR